MRWHYSAAMGLESDQEAVQLVGADPAYASLLAPTLQEGPYTNNRGEVLLQ